MPEIWTAEKDQKLLLVALELGMIDCNKVAARFSEKHGTEVTQRAVYQHLQGLNKKVGGAKANGNGGTPRKPAVATPRKPAASKAPKTPASSGKRKKTTMSDENDSDSEDEKMIHGRDSHSPVPKRQQTDRRSQTPKRYAEPESDAEADKEGAAGPSVKQEAMGDGSEQGRDRDAMSEISDFSPDATFT